MGKRQRRLLLAVLAAKLRALMLERPTPRGVDRKGQLVPP